MKFLHLGKKYASFRLKKIKNLKLIKKTISTLKAWNWSQTLMDFIFFWISPSYTIVIPTWAKGFITLPLPWVNIITIIFTYKLGKKVKLNGLK